MRPFSPPQMSLKSDLIWDKLNERLAQIDPTNRTFKVILLVHLQKDAATVKSVGESFPLPAVKITTALNHTLPICLFACLFQCLW